MALMRFHITGAVPLPLTPAQRTFISNLRVELRTLKDHCVIINPGEPNEEDITNFTYHICHHDTGELCEPEQEI